MKEEQRIPSGKVARAMKFVGTGARVGANYIKHYSKKAIDPTLEIDALHKDNASDIYKSLGQLKGSALKVAQMLSMDRNILPKAYQDQFMMAQYSAPPLSYPLVTRTFRKTFGKDPLDVFDAFSRNAERAASMGQVHKATRDGKTLAVKIQYPGVADSVKSDLKLVRPFAVRLLNINDAELEIYFKEVESKLIEETDYELELRQSLEMTTACNHLDDIAFPEYYPELSNNRILTMDWIFGDHLKEFLKSNPSQSTRNQIGQALWNFYEFQIHQLRKVHADPHPGNFIISKGKLHVIDFGCIKVIPDDFYKDYFGLIHTTDEDADLEGVFRKLNFLLPDDTPQEVALFTDLFHEMISLTSRPFHQSSFDFGEAGLFDEIYDLSERIRKMEEVKQANAARGSRHGLYINRTYFGLYNLLHILRAQVTTGY